MPGPTQDLISRCYAVLMRCDQFGSFQSLRAVFVSEELLPFRDRLRDAASMDERVRLTVDYLLYQPTMDGRNVFPLFLQALRPVNEMDTLHGDLEGLRSEFEQSLGQVNRIPVPYVVVAMKQSEAAGLQSGAVFEDPRIAPIERDRFNALVQSLPDGWLEDYGDQRDEWRLHADHDSVIGAVLDEMFAHINRCLRQPDNLPILDGVSYSEEFFSPEQQAETWEYLGQSGGLLIIDAVSLFHPLIRQALMQSTLASSEQMAVLVLSPLDFYAAPVNTHVAGLITDEMPMTFARFAKHLNHRYEMGIGDLCGMQRWLFTLFSSPEDMAGLIQKRKKDVNRRRFLNQAPPLSGRMSRAIFRQSEVGT